MNQHREKPIRKSRESQLFGNRVVPLNLFKQYCRKSEAANINKADGKDNDMKSANKSPIAVVVSACLSLLLIFSFAMNGCILVTDGTKNKGGETFPSTSGTNTYTNDLPSNQVIEDLSMELFKHEVVLDTTTLNQLVSDPSAMGISVDTPTLGDLSHKSYQLDNLYYQGLLDQLYPIDPDTLNEADVITREIIIAALEQTIKSEKFFYYSEPLTPNMGVHATLPSSLLEYSFRTRKDIDDYIALLNDVPRYFNQIIEFERTKAKAGLLMCKSSLMDVVSEIDVILIEPAANNVLVKSFDILLASEDTPFLELNDQERSKLSEANRLAVSDSIYPAYQELRGVVQALSKIAKEDSTIASMPEGKEYYALDMQIMGFDLSPEDAATLLDRRVDEYLSAMYESSNANIFGVTPEIPGLASPYPAKPALEYLSEAMLDNFPEIPEFEFSVEETPEELPNDLALAYYKVPAVDDSDDNRIYYYPQNVTDELSYLTTLAHEGFPGHMYQTNYFAQSNPLPIRKLLYSTAYMEGYAMYAEILSLKYFGLSDVDANANGAYTAFAYALQARIDIAVNYQGWSEAELSEYLSKHGLSVFSASELYDMAKIQPQVYLNYGLGLVMFKDLRAEAEATAGKKFDEYAYHDLILRNGPMPFAMLKWRVEQWAATI